MLTVRGLSKVYPLVGQDRTLFENLSFDVAPGERMALIGRNGQGKSTLIRILGGIVNPTAGTVSWDNMTYSWPLALSGGFQGGMTGYDNIKFISRIYNQPEKEILEKAEDFAEIGKALGMEVKYYSTGMKARLAFGISLAIEFDCYLIDEVIAVGDAGFTRKCMDELFGKRAHRTFIIASHGIDFLQSMCKRAIVIESGHAKVFDDLDLAVDIYKAIGVHAVDA